MEMHLFLLWTNIKKRRKFKFIETPNNKNHKRKKKDIQNSFYLIHVVIHFATHWLLVKKIDVHPYIKKKKANAAHNGSAHQFDKSTVWRLTIPVVWPWKKFWSSGERCDLHTCGTGAANVHNTGKNHRHKHFILIFILRWRRRPKKKYTSICEIK